MKKCLLPFVLALILLSACSAEAPAESGASGFEILATPVRSPLPTAEAETKPAPIFDAGLDKFILCFNRAYKAAYQSEPMPEADQWVCLEPSEISACYRYRYQGLPTVSNDPSVTVCTDSPNAPIRRITLDFSDHGYTDEAEAQYKKLCFCTLSALLPELGESSVRALYDELFTLANDESNLCSDPEAPPYAVLYRSGELALQPYYCGGMVHIAAEHMSAADFDARAAQGTVIHTIS